MIVFDDGLGPAIYLAGSFDLSGGDHHGVVRWDGGQFIPLGESELPSKWNALAVFDDGTGPALYRGGDHRIDASTFTLCIAKWTGSTWVSIAGEFNGDVRALAVFDDGSGPALYAGGEFTIAGGLPANRVAKWDGQGWSALGAGIQGGDSPVRVNAFVVHDDGTGPSLFVGGHFVNAGSVVANGLARWNGREWFGVGGGLASSSSTFPPAVNALAVFNSGSGQQLYVGGWFVSAGQIPARGIAAWNGTQWSALGTFDYWLDVHSLLPASEGGFPHLVAIGSFVDYIQGSPTLGRIAHWDGVTWTEFGGGVIGPGTWCGTAMAEFDDGSDSESALFTNMSQLSKWDGQHWKNFSHGLHGDFGALSDDGWATNMLVHDDGSGVGRSLYVTGKFGFAGSLHANRIARWNGSAWSALGLGLGGGQSAYAGSMCVFDDQLGSGPALFVGGSFSSAGGQPANSIAKWNGVVWSPLGGGLTNFSGGPARVYALAVFDDHQGRGPELYAAGSIGLAGGQPAAAIAKWDGQQWSPLDGGMNGAVYALAVFDDGHGEALYVGGEFTLAGGVAVNNLAKWDGRQWNDVGGGVTGEFNYVLALAVYDERNGHGPALFVGGNFVHAGANDITGLARWNGTTWSGVSDGTVQFVGELSVVHDDLDSPVGMYASGYVQRTGNGEFSALARWNGIFWSEIPTDLPYGGVPIGCVAAFDDNVMQEPAIYLGGNFNEMSGIRSQNIARLIPCRITDPPRYNVCHYEVTLIDASSLCPTCPTQYGVDLNDAGTVFGTVVAHSYSSISI